MAKRKISARDLMAASNDYKEMNDQRKERSYAVEFMQLMKFSKQKRDAVWEHAKGSNRKCPEMEDINMAFGRLPVWFAGDTDLALAKKITIAKLLSGKESVIEKLGIIPTFQEYRDENIIDIGARRPLVYLLNLPYAGMFALHDYPVEMMDEPGVRLTYTVPNPETLMVRRYHLEPATQLAMLLPWLKGGIDD